MKKKDKKSLKSQKIIWNISSILAFNMGFQLGWDACKYAEKMKKKK